MEKTDWLYVLAIVVIVCITVLGVTDKISSEELTDLLIWIVTAVISGFGMFYVGKYRGLQEAAGAT